MTNDKEKNEALNKSEPLMNEPTQKREDTSNDIPENNIAGLPSQLIFGEQGKEYLREASNIEDMPDEKDQSEYDKVIEEVKKKNDNEQKQE